MYITIKTMIKKYLSLLIRWFIDTECEVLVCFGMTMHYLWW